jgi:hypothetical protein
MIISIAATGSHRGLQTAASGSGIERPKLSLLDACLKHLGYLVVPFRREFLMIPME